MEMIRKYLKDKYQVGGYQIAQIEYLLKTMFSELSKMIVIGFLLHDRLTLPIRFMHDAISALLHRRAAFLYIPRLPGQHVPLYMAGDSLAAEYTAAFLHPDIRSAYMHGGLLFRGACNIQIPPAAISPAFQALHMCHLQRYIPICSYPVYYTS